MRKKINSMQLCPQGVYGILHQSYKLTIYNLLHLGQILCVANTEIYNRVSFENWFIIKKGEKKSQHRIQKK